VVERSAVNRLVVGSNPIWGDLYFSKGSFRSEFYINVKLQKTKNEDSLIPNSLEGEGNNDFVLKN
jgi:hypothetical protein